MLYCQVLEVFNDFSLRCYCSDAGRSDNLTLWYCKWIYPMWIITINLADFYQTPIYKFVTSPYSLLAGWCAHKRLEELNRKHSVSWLALIGWYTTVNTWFIGTIRVYSIWCNEIYSSISISSLSTVWSENTKVLILLYPQSMVKVL